MQRLLLWEFGSVIQVQILVKAIFFSVPPLLKQWFNGSVDWLLVRQLIKKKENWLYLTLKFT